MFRQLISSGNNELKSLRSKHFSPQIAKNAMKDAGNHLRLFWSYVTVANNWKRVAIWRFSGIVTFGLLGYIVNRLLIEATLRP